jgi:hypothetical protein
MAVTTYSNPRLSAEIADWPTGKYRTQAHFWIETDPKRGQRACRTTKHPITGKEAAPKKLTYAQKVRILDGDDGRTYIAEFSSIYRFVIIMRGDMKFEHEVIFERDPRYSQLMGLFE